MCSFTSDLQWIRKTFIWIYMVYHKYSTQRALSLKPIYEQCRKTRNIKGSLCSCRCRQVIQGIAKQRVWLQANTQSKSLLHHDLDQMNSVVIEMAYKLLHFIIAPSWKLAQALAYLTDFFIRCSYDDDDEKKISVEQIKHMDSMKMSYPFQKWSQQCIALQSSWLISHDICCRVTVRFWETIIFSLMLFHDGEIFVLSFPLQGVRSTQKYKRIITKITITVVNFENFGKGQSELGYRYTKPRRVSYLAK